MLHILGILTDHIATETETEFFWDKCKPYFGKPFWDKCKPYFSNKHAHGDSKIILIVKGNIITNENEVVLKKTLLVNNDEIANTFNNHFSETVEKLNAFKWPFNEKYENIQNKKLTAIIKKFENHLSIMKIKSNTLFTTSYCYC